MSRTIPASEVREGMTVRRITNKAYGKVFDKPVLHHTGSQWPTVTQVVVKRDDAVIGPYVWFTLSCCDSEAVRIAPDDQITVED